jgi:WD40 repeat protein
VGFNSGLVIGTLEEHTDMGVGMVVAPDGERAISTSRDKILKIWDLSEAST